MRKAIFAALRSALKDRAIFGAGLVAMAASIQLMGADAPPITVDPTPKLPIVIDPPANFPQPCSLVPVGGSPACPESPPPTLCLAGAHCADLSKAPGRMVPL